MIVRLLEGFWFLVLPVIIFLLFLFAGMFQEYPWRALVYALLFVVFAQLALFGIIYVVLRRAAEARYEYIRPWTLQRVRLFVLVIGSIVMAFTPIFL